MKPFILIALMLHFFTSNIVGQDKKDSADRYQLMENRYQRLKDSFRLSHPFIPAVSSVVIKHKQVELNYFASLASANSYRTDAGDLVDVDIKQIYLYNTLQITYGLSKNERFNVGLDINSVVGRIDQDRNSSIFKVFNPSITGNDKYAFAVTSFAPRIRWRPFKNNYKVTIQSSVSLPTAVSEEKQAILGTNQIYFLSQFLYNQPLSKRLFLFSQISLQYGFKRTNTPAVFYTPVSMYLSYYIPKKVILFALLNYVPIFTNQNKWTYSHYALQPGGGLQYQISRQVLINAYYVRVVAGKNYPELAGYNISVRCITL